MISCNGIQETQAKQFHSLQETTWPMTGQYLNQCQLNVNGEHFALEMSKNFFIESKKVICIDTDENSPFVKYAFQHSTRQPHTCQNEAKNRPNDIVLARQHSKYGIWSDYQIRKQTGFCLGSRFVGIVQKNIN